MSSRAKRKLETRMRGGAEMALRNDYAIRTEAAESAAYGKTLDHTADALAYAMNSMPRFAGIDMSPMRIGSRDFHFAPPATALPILEQGGPGLFGISAGASDPWEGHTYAAAERPGPVTPVRHAGTKARAVRLRGMVGVLQDAWHEAGVWPWRDGQKFVSKPWELTMEGLMASIERMSREDAARRYPPSYAARMEMARDAVDSGFVTPEQWVRLLDHGTMTLTDVVHAEPPAPPPKRGRVPTFIPVRRLDGRR